MADQGIKKKFFQTETSHPITSFVMDLGKTFYLGGRSVVRYYYAPKEGHERDLALKNSYLVSSEKGVFLLKKDKIVRLSMMPCYGIAVSEGKVYLAQMGESRTDYSKIVSIPLDLFLNNSIMSQQKLLYANKCIGWGGRIHQICVHGNYILVTDTAKNTIVVVDKNTGKVEREIAPFLDRFGEPILFDQNHINSVSAYGDVLLFVAYKAGKTSLVGVIGKERILGYSYKNPGVHDIHLFNKKIYLSDTFGRNVEGEGGTLIENNKPIYEEFFKKPPGVIVRAISGDEEELLVGHSHKGKRSVRFEGKGGIIVIKKNEIRMLEMPFSQVYDIIHLSGEHFKGPNEKTEDFEEICKICEKHFGKPIYEVRTKDCVIKPKG